MLRCILLSAKLIGLEIVLLMLVYILNSLIARSLSKKMSVSSPEILKISGIVNYFSNLSVTTEKKIQNILYKYRNN